MDDKKKPLGMILGQTMASLMRYVKPRIIIHTDTKITIDQYRLMYAIRDRNEVIQKDMAEYMGKDKSSILRMIDSLESKDLLRRVTDSNDRRKNVIELTASGEATIEELLNQEEKIKQIIFEGLDEGDIEAFYRVMNHIRQKTN